MLTTSLPSTKKVLQVFHRPLFDYWTVFYQALMEMPNLLVIGYSGHDEHFNRLLQEAAQHNSQLRRIIWVIGQGISPPALYLRVDHTGSRTAATRSAWRRRKHISPDMGGHGGYREPY